MSLWAAEVKVPPIRNGSSSSKPSSQLSPAIIIPNPEEDAARMAALKRLRHKLVQLCSKSNKSKPPTLAFERWLGRAALRRQPNDDPIIPSDGILDQGLAKDLSRTLSSFAEAKGVAKEMTEEATKQVQLILSRGGEVNDSNKDRSTIRKGIRDDARAVKKAAKTAILNLRKAELCESENNDDSDADQKVHLQLRISLASLQKANIALGNSTREAQRSVVGDTAGGGEIAINGKRREGIYDVMLCGGPDGKPKRPYLTISSEHLSKLLQLWNLQEGKKVGEGGKVDTSSPIEIMNALDSDDRTMFQKSLYCCLARYEALKGAGYQCAVPGVAFDAAAAGCGLGTTIECFASPLNCRYQKFCSAFPDIESRFGSMGSFFDDKAFDPFEGSFEANPPFVPETMIAMGKKLERLLNDDGRGALSFLVVVPAWGAGIPFCRDLESSIHMRASSRIKASHHAFCDGAQHTKPLLSKKDDNSRVQPDMRPSSWDTAVILLQNDAGAMRWSVNKSKLEESFCNAFKDASKHVPQKYATLGEWESRGVGQGGSKRPWKRLITDDGNSTQHGNKKQRGS